MNNINDLFCRPEVGKRYVTRGGWITPPLEAQNSERYPFATSCEWSFTNSGTVRYDEKPHDFDLIAEYVEPTADTYRRDLEAKLMVAGFGALFIDATGKGRKIDCLALANTCIRAAAALIEAQEAAK